MFTVDEARELLEKAKVFFDVDNDDPPEEQSYRQTLNLSDTWGWACAFSQHVPDEKLPEVAQLFWRYGWAGILYWVSEQHGGIRSEFHDINRFVDFVRHEERIRKEVPNSDQRAYTKLRYELGA